MPAIAKGAREVKPVTSWPKGFPGLGTSAASLAKLITDASGGRLRVEDSRPFPPRFALGAKFYAGADGLSTRA